MNKVKLSLVLGILLFIGILFIPGSARPTTYCEETNLNKLNTNNKLSNNSVYCYPAQVTHKGWPIKIDNVTYKINGETFNGSQNKTYGALDMLADILSLSVLIYIVLRIIEKATDH